MRALRLLFLAGVAATAFFVYRDYQASRRERERTLPAAPEAIAANVASRSGRWEYEQSDAESARVTVSALGFRQGKDSSQIELSDVELRVYHDDNQVFDRIETPEAVFDMAASRLASEAQVTITLGVPAADPELTSPRLTRIVAQGAVFDTKAGTGNTDNETAYYFADGIGRSRGAFYDSASRYFQMKSRARIERFASGPDGRKTIITAGRLYYQEKDDRVDLRDGASLERGGQRIEAAEAEVLLSDGKVRQIDARDARGSDSGEGRTVEFQSPRLSAFYREDQSLERVQGEGPSRMVSTRAASRLTVTGDEMDLRYGAPAQGGESVLDEALVRRNSRVLVESPPSGDTRLIEAPWLRLKMRAGGESAELVETLERGRMTLTPAGASGPGERLEADRIRVDYTADNQMDKLSANGKVVLWRAAAEPEGEPLRTWSDVLTVAFDQAGEVRSLEQTGAFRFEDGGRAGAADGALFTPADERLVLTGSSHVEDSAGRVSAHEIRLLQRENKLYAQGDVAAVYRDQAAQPSSGLFAQGEPVFAASHQMESDQAQGLIVYRGAARLWQGANRVEGRTIRIDRPAKRLQAEDEVVTFLEEQPEDGAGEPSLLAVRAGTLDYSDETRVASYEQNVRFERGGLSVRANRLQAQLSQPGTEQNTSLERAVAEGAVEILDRSVNRKGLGEHAVYSPATEHVTLRGEPARALNEAGEETRGAELNYALNDDRLQVSGGSQRAVTFRRRNR